MTSVLHLPVAAQYPSMTPTSVSDISILISGIVAVLAAANLEMLNERSQCPDPRVTGFPVTDLEQRVRGNADFVCKLTHFVESHLGELPGDESKNVHVENVTVFGDIGQ